MGDLTIAPEVGEIRVEFRRNPFDAEVEAFTCPARVGEWRPSIADIEARMRGDLGVRGPVHFFCGVGEVGWKARRYVRPRAGVTVYAFASVRGDVAKKLGTLLIVAAATALAGPLGAAVATSLGLAAGSIGAALVTGAVTIGLSVAGALASSLLFPPPKQPRLDDGIAASRAYSITGAQNSANPDGVIPDLLGKHRVYFDLAALPYYQVEGGDQVVSMLLIAGHGDIAVTDLKIGEAPIDLFDGVEYEIMRDRVNPTSPLARRLVKEENVASDLPRGEWVTRVTEPSVTSFSVEIVIPTGSYRIDKKGRRKAWPVNLEIQYRAVGASTWIVLPGGNFGEDNAVFQINTKSRSLLRRKFRAYLLEPDQYEVRVRKNSPADNELTEGILENFSGSTFVSRTQYLLLRSFVDGNPIQLGKPVTAIALEITASNQIQGQIRTVNAICQRIGWRFNGSAWVEGSPRNVAETYVTWLRSSAHEIPKADSEIHWDSIEEFHDFCELHGFEFHQIRDFVTTPLEAANAILAAGRARVKFIGGKWGVIYDEGAAAPITLAFTAANLENLTGARSLDVAPHAFRVPFKNRNKGWRDDERIVYRRGYEASTAQRIETLRLEGITDPAKIWRAARYVFRQIETQARTWRFEVNHEYHLAQIGDRAYLSHPAVAGITAGRVRSVDGSSVTVSQKLTIEAGKTYKLRVVSTADGTDTGYTVTTGATAETKTVAVTPSPAAVEAGDMFYFGEAGATRRRVVVREIEPSIDGGAMITVFSESPDIPDDDTVTPPAFASTAPDGVDLTQNPPQRVTATPLLAPSAFGAQTNVTIEIEPGGVAEVDLARVRWRRTDVPDQWEVVASRDLVVVIPDVIDGSYEFQARTKALGADLFSLWSASEYLTVSRDTAPPADLENVRISHRDGIATIDADPPADVNRSHFVVRYTPLLAGASKLDGATLVDRFTSFPITAPARGGSYFVNAVSWSGVESATTSLVTLNAQVGEIIDAIEELDLAPAWTGTHDGTAEIDGTLRLATARDLLDGEDLFEEDLFGPFQSEGTFTSSIRIDLEGVFDASLGLVLDVSAIRTDADLFVGDLLEIELFGDVAADVTSVVVEYRSTEDDPDDDPTWSDWQPLVPRDQSLWALEARLRLATTDPGVTPVVRAATVIVDLEEREERGTQVSVGAGGATITYAKPFKRILAGPLINGQNGAAGDRPVVTLEGLTGYHIAWVDEAGDPIAHDFTFRTVGN